MHTGRRRPVVHDAGHGEEYLLVEVFLGRRGFLLHVLPKCFHKVRYHGLWHPAKHQQQANARLLLETRPTRRRRDTGARLGDLAKKALAISDMEAHGYAVKCPKCRSVNVLLLIELRRGSTAMVS